MKASKMTKTVQNFCREEGISKGTYFFGKYKKNKLNILFLFVALSGVNQITSTAAQNFFLLWRLFKVVGR